MGKQAFAEKLWVEAEADFQSVRAILTELAETIPDKELQSNFQQRGPARIPAVPASDIRQAYKQTFGGLTDREMEVAKMIADKLVLSKRTVEQHVANILLKIDLNSRQ